MARGGEGNPAISLKLLKWYRRARRAMPWRGTRDPYAIWISETMLQQTQVATVIPYYAKFLKRFPRVRDLAEARLDDVMRMWAGLGYYARARNLHAAARQIVDDHAGRLPDTVEALRELPGFGPYTAGAVASIAFDRRAAVVDGNVARVLARIFAIRGDLKSGTARARLWRLAESLLPSRNCGDSNQAMMELGATVCTPTSPQCGSCPLSGECSALKRGLVDRLPEASDRTRVRAETHVVAAVTCGGRWLFVRRAERGLWGGLWELPTLRCESKQTASAARRLAMEVCGAVIDCEATAFCRIQRQLSHRAIEFVGHVCRAAAAARLSNGTWRSLARTDDLGMSRAMHDVIQALLHRTGVDGAGRRRRAATA